MIKSVDIEKSTENKDFEELVFYRKRDGNTDNA